MKYVWSKLDNRLIIIDSDIEHTHLQSVKKFNLFWMKQFVVTKYVCFKYLEEQGQF